MIHLIKPTWSSSWHAFIFTPPFSARKLTIILMVLLITQYLWYHISSLLIRNFEKEEKCTHLLQIEHICMCLCVQKSIYKYLAKQLHRIKLTFYLVYKRLPQSTRPKFSILCFLINANKIFRSDFLPLNVDGLSWHSF